MQTLCCIILPRSLARILLLSVELWQTSARSSFVGIGAIRTAEAIRVIERQGMEKVRGILQNGGVTRAESG